MSVPFLLDRLTVVPAWMEPDVWISLEKIVIEIGEISIIVINFVSLDMFDLPIIKHVFSASNLSDLGPESSRSLEITLVVTHEYTMSTLPLVSSSKMILGL